MVLSIARLPIGEHLRGFDPSVRADHSERDVPTLQDFDEVWTRHVEQVRGLLGRQFAVVRDEGHGRLMGHVVQHVRNQP
jgi:hypothetical protein